jgi:hypothetical protein
VCPFYLYRVCSRISLANGQIQLTNWARLH